MYKDVVSATPQMLWVAQGNNNSIELGSYRITLINRLMSTDINK